jgi:hypothetical protein
VSKYCRLLEDGSYWVDIEYARAKGKERYDMLSKQPQLDTDTIIFIYGTQN